MANPPEVLIVEDEPVVLKVAGMALSANGIGFEKATDVSSAKSLLEAQSFKVVLTDLKLPGESGFELLKTTTKLSPPPQVIVITGYATIENTLLTFARGCFDFIPKPFDVDELASVVSRALRFSDLSQPISPRDESRFSLGRHSWAQMDPDGTATLGVGETLTGVTGTLETIECLSLEDHTVQGQCFCRLVSADGLTHRVWAPLSGRVIMINTAATVDLELIHRDPFASGWLVRVIPNNTKKELPKLSQAEEAVFS